VIIVWKFSQYKLHLKIKDRKTVSDEGCMIKPAVNCKENLFDLSQNIEAVICLPFPEICIV
jgi:hypothetical protein